MSLKVNIIGSGNVATHLARALAGKVTIAAIHSRNSGHAARLASETGARVAVTLDDIDPNADFTIVAVNDDAVKEIAEAKYPTHFASADKPTDTTCDAPLGKPWGGVWMHTSGSVPMEVWQGKRPQYGVFYPLQTLSRDVKIDFARVPMFIEGCDEATLAAIRDLASLVSQRVEVADSARRRQLHIAAVFACNFVNFMWTQADDLLQEHSLSIDVLEPLLEETLRKCLTASPAKSQTGPARRGDRQVMASHAAQLDGDARFIYETLSHLIMKRYGHD